MPGFTVTRGFGPGATPSNLIARGFIPAEEVVRILRGGGRAAKRLARDLTDQFRITAALVSHNSKIISNPLIKKVRKTFGVKNISISIETKSVKSRKSNKVSVSAKNIRVRNKNNV